QTGRFPSRHVCCHTQLKEAAVLTNRTVNTAKRRTSLRRKDEGGLFRLIMASRRTSTMPSTLKNPTAAAKSSKSGNSASKANNSGAGKKVVKPMSRETEPSLLGKSILQSTFSDGHYFRPDFDISVIKDKTILENATESERNPEIEKMNIKMQTLLLAYLTAKMEHNTAKLKAEAEKGILQVMEEEEALRNEVHEKKRRYLLAEKNRLGNELLDLQIAALTPVAEAAKQFTEDYKCFATAVDATRHELPVKNFYIDGDRREFLGYKAEASLKESEKLLLECTEGDHKDNSTSLECLKDMKMTSKDISQQLSGAISELLELSSLVCRHTIHVQQGIEEECLGTTRTRELYSSKQ
ncbi:hypothetical protein INR49_019635, partial [Caranx melampygus]